MDGNDNLENLVRSGGLKAEPPDHKECEGLLRSEVVKISSAVARPPPGVRGKAFGGGRSRREFFHKLSTMDRLKDAHIPALSFASRFDLAYNAAHALALTAMRLQGYRSDRRYLVFQCLVHTLGLSKAQVRLFALCHERRNLAEYEGYMDVDETLLAELVAATDALLPLVQQAMAAGK